MILASIFGINHNVISVHNDKNIKFFYQNFVNIALEAGEGIKKNKKYNFVLEIAVLRLKGSFPLITPLNSH